MTPCPLCQRMRRPAQQSVCAECLLALQVEQAGYSLEREYRFARPRRWRADGALLEQRILYEVDGGAWLPGGGRHTRGAGFEADCEKSNQAQLLGFRVFRFTPSMVYSGEAIAVLKQAVLGRVA